MRKYDHITPPARLMNFDVILAGFRGSIAHGTHVPSTDPDSIDDIDWIGVIVRPMDFYYGLGQPQRDSEESFEGEHDMVLYELSKFARLMRKCNPNVLATLWAPPHLIVRQEPAGAMLIEIRDAFLSKQLYAPFVGYAHSQLKRMTGFGDEKQQYKGAKRKELIQKHGYDTKNAAHLIRILRMGIEALERGELLIERPDAQELRDIKAGKWSLALVQDEATHLFDRAEQARLSSALPEEPDHERIDRTLRNIFRMYHGSYDVVRSRP